ncbi:GNAT family N-acetyltransferase [Echinicola shivajiensis]|uniref:GNAT family N-acetyltransferase n=1 Tax=Echinicola shivajiensis TaxID=1035916 RepID=UPI001BFC1A60|nr:GNAT family N-acetyltransferase [Echinicola shivajiensis]
MFKKFETERLLIHPTSEDDAELIYQVMNTPKLLKYVGDRGIHSVMDAEKYIRRSMLPQLKTLGFSCYSLIKKMDGAKVGTCGLYDRPGIEGIDIGFGLLPQYEGLGFAFEAAQRLMKAAFEDFELTEVKGITAKENTSSQRLLVKLGMDMVGTTKLPNELDEVFLYLKMKTN